MGGSKNEDKTYVFKNIHIGETFDGTNKTPSTTVSMVLNTSVLKLRYPSSNRLSSFQDPEARGHSSAASCVAGAVDSPCYTDVWLGGNEQDMGVGKSIVWGRKVSVDLTFPLSVAM